jgi:DNA-binding PadR family transcriptional regulator
MFRTQTVRAVVGELLKAPDAEHYGNGLKSALGLDTNVIYAILNRLRVEGYLTDLGMRPSATGGSPRRMYKVKDAQRLRELLSRPE